MPLDDLVHQLVHGHLGIGCAGGFSSRRLDRF
jgi:hypothetical protein